MRTFTAVQIERYLKRKSVHKFCSEAEKDVILDIINDYWEEIRDLPQLGQMDTIRRIKTYYKITVVFPYFIAEEENIINIDFREKRRISGNDLCYCGSGKKFGQCCGKAPSLDKLLNGSI